MKIKNVRIWLAGLLVFAIITGPQACQDYHLKQEQKEANMLNHKIEEIQLEDIFTPADENAIDNIDVSPIKVGK